MDSLVIPETINGGFEEVDEFNQDIKFLKEDCKRKVEKFLFTGCNVKIFQNKTP